MQKGRERLPPRLLRAVFLPHCVEKLPGFGQKRKLRCTKVACGIRSVLRKLMFSQVGFGNFLHDDGLLCPEGCEGAVSCISVLEYDHETAIFDTALPNPPMKHANLQPGSCQRSTCCKNGNNVARETLREDNSYESKRRSGTRGVRNAGFRRKKKWEASWANIC